MKDLKVKSDKYSEYYKDLEKWVDYMNPCEIKIKDSKIVCINYPDGNKDNALCCGSVITTDPIYNCKCKHLKGKCTVKSLGCKQWFCEKALENIISNKNREDVINFLATITHITTEVRLHFIPCMPRTSKKDNFEYAKKIFK